MHFFSGFKTLQDNTTLRVSGIGAVVKVVDSHLCERGSIPDKSCSFFIVTSVLHAP